MNVLHISPSYKPAFLYGGPTVSVSRLCEILVKAGAQVEVMTTTANGKNELPFITGKPVNVDGAEVIYYARWTGDHTHFSPKLLWDLFLYVPQCPAIHIHSWWNLVSMGAVLICWLRGVRPVLSPRGTLNTSALASGKAGLKKFFNRTLGKFLLRRTILHATSVQEAEEAQKLISGWQHFILPNLPELPDERFHSFRKSDNATIFQLIFLGRLHPIKGLDILFSALRLSTCPWHLTIVGEGNPEYVTQLKQTASILGIENRICWAGWIKGNEKYKLLADSDLFVLNSHSENFANSVLEALAVGTPVLVANSVGLSDYVLAQDLGWVTPLEERAIADTLTDAWRNREKREAIREKASTCIYRDFDSQVIARQYLEAYRRYPARKGSNG